MAWTERQRALLRAMGLRVWQARGTAVVEAVVDPEIGDAAAGTDASLPADRWPSENDASSAADPAPSASGAPSAAGLPPDATGARLAAGPPPSATAATGAAWLVVADIVAGRDDRAERLLDAMLRALAMAHGRAAWPAPRVVSSGEAAAAADAALPRAIVAFGRPAALALLGGDEPLGQLRGRVHDRRGVPLVVSYDVGYLLRHPLDKARVWDDLCRAADAAR